MGDEAVRQFAQGSCGCPIPQSGPDQVGWGFARPGLVEDAPVYGRGLGLDDL